MLLIIGLLKSAGYKYNSNQVLKTSWMHAMDGYILPFVATNFHLDVTGKGKDWHLEKNVLQTIAVLNESCANGNIENRTELRLLFTVMHHILLQVIHLTKVTVIVTETSTLVQHCRKYFYVVRWCAAVKLRAIFLPLNPPTTYLSEAWPLPAHPARKPTKNREVDIGAFHALSHTRSHYETKQQWCNCHWLYHRLNWHNWLCGCCLFFFI